MITRIFSGVLALSLCLPCLAVHAESVETAAKASMSLDVVQSAIKALSLLPDNCAKEPKKCSPELISQVLDKSFFNNPMTKMSDTESARKELIEIMQYLATHAKPEQVQKLKTASEAYQKSLREFQQGVLGDQDAAILKFFTAAQERAKLSSVKANMHTIQTIVETYGVDFGGMYAPDIKSLVREAQKSSSYGAYWKDFTNPFTGTTGAGMKGSVTDFRSYQNNPDHKAFAGLVLYEPLKDKSNQITSYRIYGCDAQGELIKNGSETFILTNY